MQLTACSTASPTNRADGDLVRRTGKDWPGDRHSWPLRTSAAHQGSARASEAVPEAHFSGLLPDFRSPGSEPGATRVLGCISAVAWGLCRTCQVLDVNPPLTCGKLGSCTRHALVLKDARTLSPPRVCVPALPSPQGSETVAGESTLPARPRAGVSRTQPRSGQRRAGRAAGQCLRRGRRAHPLAMHQSICASLGHSDAFRPTVSGFLETLRLRAASSHHADTVSPPAGRLRGRQVPAAASIRGSAGRDRKVAVISPA